MAKNTTAKTKTAKRARTSPATSASRNGHRRTKKKPTLEELTLRSFRLAYEQHHRKSV